MYKALRDECIEAYQKIISGCKKTLFPPGFYMPGRVRHAEALPIT